MAMEKMKNKERYAGLLAEIFRIGDSSGDGAIDAVEFKRMMREEKVLSVFEQLELEVPEVKMLFDVLSDEDGEADYEEFLAAAVKMKNSARCIDTIQILRLAVLRLAVLRL